MITEELLKVVTRRCDSCGAEESRTVLETDTPGIELTWERPWRQFRFTTWTRSGEMQDACSKRCFTALAELAADLWT